MECKVKMKAGGIELFVSSFDHYSLFFTDNIDKAVVIDNSSRTVVRDLYRGFDSYFVSGYEEMLDDLSDKEIDQLEKSTPTVFDLGIESIELIPA